MHARSVIAFHDRLVVELEDDAVAEFPDDVDALRAPAVADVLMGARSTRVPFSSVTGTIFSGWIACWADLSSVGGGPWSTGAGSGACTCSPFC
ncbi:hypothetical protein AJ88_25990 [Mesorhizobium amorphae CCBAU 01583]|nr:hypothetical protein AJ88_25990 [Mesorhizobium amorphae CCBAU 01583]